MIKCKTCGGIYTDTFQDGTKYYHACPPIDLSDTKFTERPDRRDENVGKKLEGKGSESVTEIIVL